MAMPSQQAQWVVAPSTDDEARTTKLLFGFFVAFVLAGGIFTLDNTTASTAEGNSLRQIIFLLMLFLTVAQAKPMQDQRRLLILPVSLTVALAWCWLSVTWSDVPDIAIRRIALTTMIIFTEFLAVSLLGAETTLRVVTKVCIALLAANLLFALGAPGVGVHHSDEFEGELAGAWRGLLVHKNMAGSVTAVTFMLCWFNPASLSRWARLAALATAALFLWGTNSKTSIGLLPPSILAGVIYARYQTTRPLALKSALIALVAVAALAIIVNQETIAAVFDEKDALTGRVQIWPLLTAYIAEHPLLGAGYGSFWNVGPGGPIYLLSGASDDWVDEMASGHQGYLDLLTQIGAPGLLLVVYATTIGPLRTLATLKTLPRATVALLIALLAFCVGHNFTESSLLDRDANVNFFLMLAIAIVEGERRLGQGAWRHPG
jgi:O-antigen ligase